MYEGYSGMNHVCTWVAIRPITYNRTIFLGRSRSIQAEFNNSTSDVKRLYR
jgi:hypothetical protein